MTTNAFDSIRFIEISIDIIDTIVSIEDKLYKLLDDICSNAGTYTIHRTAIQYKHILLEAKSYDDETNLLIIDYSDALQDYRFLKNLLNWLNFINPSLIEYKNLQYIYKYEDDDLIENMRNYILFDDWWEDFVKLRKELEKLYNELLLKQ